MRPSNLLPLFFTQAALAFKIPSSLYITHPSADKPWYDGQANVLSWDAGKEGIVEFDLKLTRLRGDGIQYLASNAQMEWDGLTITLADVPTGDDYYITVIHAGDGIVYARSDRFSILPRNSTASSSSAHQTFPENEIVVKGPPSPVKGWARAWSATSEQGQGKWQLTDSAGRDGTARWMMVAAGAVAVLGAWVM